MKKNVFFVGMLVMALVFGLVFTACSTDSDDDDEGGAKTLIITNISQDVADNATDGIIVAIAPVGTTYTQVMESGTMIAGAQSDGENAMLSSSAAPYTCTVKLYTFLATSEDGVGFTNTRWTGSGVYDVFIFLYDDNNSGSEGPSSVVYKENVSFTSATKTISYGELTSVF
jgi:hypothetical protein